MVRSNFTIQKTSQKYEASSLVKFWQVAAEIHLIKDNTFDEGVVRAWSDQVVIMTKTTPGV